MSKTFAKLLFSLLGHSNEISNSATKSAKACWDVWWDCVTNSWWLNQDKTNLCWSSSQHCQRYSSAQRKHNVWVAVVFKMLIAVSVDWGFVLSLIFFLIFPVSVHEINTLDSYICLPVHNVIHIWFVAASQTSPSHFSLSLSIYSTFYISILGQEGS